MIDITHKQYLVSAKKKVLSSMKEIPLKNGIFLYIGKGLNYAILEDAKHRNYVIIGDAFLVEQQDKSVLDVLSSFSGDDINDLLFTWAGKWIVLCDDFLQLDAAGGMSAFYTEGAEWCISSSLALISQIKGIKPSGKVNKSGLNWQILPYTVLDGVKALLSTQKIKITSNNITIEPNLWFKDYTSLSTDDKVTELCECLKNGMSNIAKYSDRDIWVAMTSGKDSRLVLASALSSGIEVSAYTFEYSNISHADKKLPEQISKDFCIPYHFIRKGKVHKDRETDYETFSCGNSLGADLFFYSTKQTEYIPENAIVIKGGFFEAGQVYARRIAGDTYASLTEGMREYYKEEFKDSRQTNSYQEWLDFVTENDVDWLDVRDRFYIEQRVRGWGAAIEQASSINKWDSIQLANCRKILSILLSADNNERKNLTLSFESIKYLKPEMMRYPFNKPSFIDKVNLIISVLLSKNRLRRNLKKILKWKKK